MRKSPDKMTTAGRTQSAPVMSIRINACQRLLAQDRIIDEETRRGSIDRISFDMLLDLYVAEYDGEKRSIWDVSATAIAPMSTAHRRIALLVQHGLVNRVLGRSDRRRVIVTLTSPGRNLIEHALDRLGNPQS